MESSDLMINHTILLWFTHVTEFPHLHGRISKLEDIIVIIYVSDFNKGRHYTYKIYLYVKTNGLKKFGSILTEFRDFYTKNRQKHCLLCNFYVLIHIYHRVYPYSPIKGWSSPPLPWSLFLIFFGLTYSLSYILWVPFF